MRKVEWTHVFTLRITHSTFHMSFMRWVQSSIGKKVMMAASGLALTGFLIAHLMGNLLIFRGPDALNAYAKEARGLGPLLWVARLGLLAAALIHIATSLQLARENAAARPIGYRRVRRQETTWAARSMVASGVGVGAYLVYHLLHFTFRLAHPELSRAVDALGHHDVYLMVVRSFEQQPIALAYVVGMAAVCFHVSHGFGSAFQTLGLTTERTIPAWRLASQLFALAIFLGYCSIPVAVFFGILP